MLRNTLRRGRSFVPDIRLRCLSWIRTRRSSFVLIFITTAPLIWTLFRPRLAGLLLEHFTGVADALLLVRIGLPEPAGVRRHLPDQLAIHAGHGDVRLLVDRQVDPDRDVEHDRMRVAEREDGLFAFELRAVPDADDVELALEPAGDAGHGVRDEGPRQAVELAQALVLGRRFRQELTGGELEVDAGRMRLPQLALRALNLDGAVDHIDGDAFGNRDGLLSDS